MGKRFVFTNLSFDSVLQAPGRPDEDTRGGFTRGGWAAPCTAMMHAGDPRLFAGALFFGRRTYEDFYAVWPQRELGQDLLVTGRGELVQSLVRGNLVDECILLIHPLVLGQGRRLFPDGGAPATLRLLGAKSTPTGVAIASFAPAEPGPSPG